MANKETEGRGQRRVYLTLEKRVYDLGVFLVFRIIGAGH